MTEHARSTSSGRFQEWLDETSRLDELTKCFIIGPMKSGTTWLVRALGEHPDVAALFETHAAEVLLPKIRDAFDHYRRQLDAWGPWPHTGLTHEDERFLQRTMVDRLLVRYARATGKWDHPGLRVVADKTPMHALRVTELATIYSNAKFILCTRDVRDAAVSAWKQLHGHAGHRKDATFEDYARHYAVDLWAKPIAAAHRSFAALSPDRWMIVEYEAHKRNPRAVLRDCFRFLHVDDADAIVERVAHASDFRQVTGRDAGQEDRCFYRKGIVGDWVNHMTPECGEELVRLARASLEQ